MSPRWAPMALRSPISLVRSVTVVNIIFIIPIPPTNKEIPATEANKVVNTPVTLEAVATMSAWLTTLKSAAAALAILCLTKSNSVICCCTLSITAWLWACTAILLTYLLPVKNCCEVVKGI